MSTFKLHETTDRGAKAFYWTEVADNGETLSTSELYTRKESAEDGWDARGGLGIVSDHRRA